jgi:hypothetical protein
MEDAETAPWRSLFMRHHPRRLAATSTRDFPPSGATGSASALKHLDGTALVTMIGTDQRTYQLRERIRSCDDRLRVRMTWTRDDVSLRLEGHEVARVKMERRREL